MKWTDAQRAAIEARGSNLLVSAAAGSGKTAVLAARIVELVREGANVNDLLVVTFTKAAAAEMRARILFELHDAARDDPFLAAQALRVERADISTLHGFCSQLCHDYFEAADVDPSFRIADTAEAAVLRETALIDALTTCYEHPSSTFSYAAACLEQQRLAQAVDDLHRFLMARPDPWAWLDDAIIMHNLEADNLRNSPWMDVLLSRVALDASLAVAAYERLVAFCRGTGIFVPLAEEELEKAQAYLAAAQEGYLALLAMEKIAFRTKPRKTKEISAEDDEQFKTLRDAAKKALQAAQTGFEQLTMLEEGAADEVDVGLVLSGVAEVTRAFDERFRALKQEKNLLDFNDLEHCALHALRQDDVAASLHARYKAIFVDEYQDSSLLQEALLQRATRGDNLFLVGDVKQSIYRFRLAEPSLFLHKLKTFSPVPGALDRKIALNANFRSQPLLLEGINEVFERVFSGGTMELTYEEEARLVPGLAPSDDDTAVELHLMTDAVENEDVGGEYEEDDAPTAAELTAEAKEAVRQEAEVIADRIEALLADETHAYPLRDMAILMRTMRGKSAQMVETLRARGIAAWSDLGEDALERPEIQSIRALLAVIDNLRQDVPLLSALRGPALGLSDDSLAAIRIAHPEGSFAEAMLAYAAEKGDALAEALRGFVERVRGWALDAQVLPLDQLVRMLYEETGLFAQAGTRPDGDTRQANLRTMAEQAGNYQRAQVGSLGGFLRYLDRLQARDGMEARALGERDDVIRILSIHKSKGLQFPVTFVAGLGRRFRNLDAKNPLQLHPTLGIGMQHIDPELRTKRRTLSQAAIIERQRQQDLAEEARVLYVAMTRAERRLILIGTPGRGDTERWLDAPTPPLPAAARSMLDWIVPTALGSDRWAVFYHVPERLPAAPRASAAIRRIVETARELPAPDEDSPIARQLSWHAEVQAREPLKQSVSSVVRAEAKEGEREDTPVLLESLPRRPLFLEGRGLNAAERGDAVHAFLRAAPLDAQDLEAVRRMLEEKGILSEEQAKSLPMAKLRHSFAGPLWARMRAADELHREWPFNLSVTREGQRGLLQGVIDCCFIEDGQWVVVDYKTDRNPDPELVIERYRPQLALYADALEKMTGIPVKERILYLIDKEIGYAL